MDIAPINKYVVEELEQEIEENKERELCKNAYWITKDGKEIKITELEEEHLDNIIKMLEKHYDPLELSNKKYYKCLVREKENRTIKSLKRFGTIVNALTQ